jgi:hypothetical protein
VLDLAELQAEMKTRVVIVIDTTPPEITIIGNPDAVVHHEHEGGTAYQDHGAVAFDLVDGNVTVVTTGNDFDTTHVRRHIVTYTSTDAENNSATVTRKVNVIDTTEPEITLIGSELEVVEAHATAAYVDKGASAYDLVDGDISDEIEVEEAVDLSRPRRAAYTVQFDVKDTQGLTAETVYRKVLVKDTLPPVVTLLGAPHMVIEAVGVYEEPGWTSIDQLDLDLHDKVVVTYKDHQGANIFKRSFVTNVPDTTNYTITYSCDDKAGNTFAVDRVVTIRDTTPPVLTLKQPNMTLEIKTSWFDPGFSKAQDKLDGYVGNKVVRKVLLVRPSGELMLGSTEQMPFDDVGTEYIIKYTVEDEAGNQAEEIRRLTIVDTTPPIITLLGDERIRHEGATAFVDPGFTAVDKYDNAARGLDDMGDVSDQVFVSYTRDGENVTQLDVMAPAGTTYLITYAVTDTSGNVATSRLRWVLIIDETPPVLHLKGDVNLLYDAGGEDSLFVDPGITANDTLDGDITSRISISYRRTWLVEKLLEPACTGEEAPEWRLPSKDVDILFTTEAAGTMYNITYTVADLEANEVSVTRQVMLVDNVPPVLRLVGDAEQTAEAGQPFRDEGAVSNDIISGQLSGCINTTGSVDTSGTTGSKFVVAYTSVDDAGNGATKERSVELVDTLDPKLTILGAREMIVRVDEAFELATCICSDLADPDIECKGTLQADDERLLEPGVYSTTFSCTDSAGHTTTQIAMVRILEPKVRCRLSSVVCCRDILVTGVFCFD